MRLLSFEDIGGERVGLLAGDGTVVPLGDLVSWAADWTMAAALWPESWTELEAAGVRERLAEAEGGLPLGNVRLLAPIPRPQRNAFCVGWNYAEHVAEGRRAAGREPAREPPPHPAFFTKNPACVVGTEAEVWHPEPHSSELDWEVELAVIIGRAGRDIREERALDYVFGYTVANDVSVRDFQRERHGGQWFKGKNFDTHLPLGPWIVTADELRDPQRLRITSRVNDVTKQDANTASMVFSVARIIAELSVGMALEPGDVILTGTPEGVGFARTPPEFLRVGDVVECEIERIGVLRNSVVARPDLGAAEPRKPRVTAQASPAS
jgi:2-keto-4-pentenoate hydratase/2-oxohepta-3-ene-1,7-dioic acid hydratase in catechol pathway